MNEPARESTLVKNTKEKFTIEDLLQSNFNEKEEEQDDHETGETFEEFVKNGFEEFIKNGFQIKVKEEQEEDYIEEEDSEEEDESEVKNYFEEENIEEEIEENLNNSRDPITRKALSELSAKHAKLGDLHKQKIKLERGIEDKELYFVSHEQNVANVIDSKYEELESIKSMIDKVKDERKDKLKTVDQIDSELSDLEKKMNGLKRKRGELVEGSNQDSFKREEYELKKQKLEKDIETELRINTKRGNSINAIIKDWRIRLTETNKSIENLPCEFSRPENPNEQLIKFIEDQISVKERELECPVCMEVASVPILMCQEQHLICSGCQSSVSQCPVCREPYEGTIKRHRYAEKEAEELAKLKSQKIQLAALHTTP